MCAVSQMLILSENNCFQNESNSPKCFLLEFQWFEIWAMMKADKSWCRRDWTWSDQLREKTFCCYWKYLIIIIFDKFWDGCVAHLMEKARYRHFEGRRDNGLAGIVPHLFAISKRTVSLLRCSCSCRDAKFFRLQSKFHSGNWQFRPCWSHDRTHSGERARRWQLFVQFPVLSMCGNEK